MRVAFAAFAVAWKTLVANGCSYVEVPYGDDARDAVIARTMELGGQFLEEAWKIKAYPKGHTFFTRILPDGRVDSERQLEKSGQFVGEIAFVSAVGEIGTSERLQIAADGLNMKGLAVSAHTFVRAQYQDGHSHRKADPALEVQMIALVPLLLSKFSRVAQVVEYIERGDLVVTGVPYIKGGFLNLHYSIKDELGHSIVLEYVDGAPKIHNNTVGVMTNDPGFDFHLLHLNQFSNVGPSMGNRGTDLGLIETEVGPVPKAWNHGFNLVGLPGDLTPAGRFVRLFFMRQLAVHSTGRPANEHDAIVLASQLLNSVTIPRGTLAKHSVFEPSDFTQWSILKIPSSRSILIRDYVNGRWRRIDLARLEPTLKALGKPLVMDIFTGDLGIQDVSDAMH